MPPLLEKALWSLFTALLTAVIGFLVLRWRRSKDRAAIDRGDESRSIKLHAVHVVKEGGHDVVVIRTLKEEHNPERLIHNLAAVQAFETAVQRAAQSDEGILVGADDGPWRRVRGNLSNWICGLTALAPYRTVNAVLILANEAKPSGRQLVAILVPYDLLGLFQDWATCRTFYGEHAESCARRVKTIYRALQIMKERPLDESDPWRTLQVRLPNDWTLTGPPVELGLSSMPIRD